MTTSDAVTIKHAFGRERLLALAVSEGLARKGPKFACPTRCSPKPDCCSVSEKDGACLWHCHRCDAGGDVISLIEKARGCSFADALNFLRGPGQAIVAAVKDRKPRAPPPPATKLWSELATTDVAGVEYLRTRGLERAGELSLVRFNVGRSTYAWLNGKARENYRVAVPMYSVTGEVCQLQLRSITPNIEPGDAKRSLPGRYPPGGVAIGAVPEAASAQRIYLAEGIADTIALQLAGVVAVGAPGVDQVRHLPAFLGQLRGREVVLCPQNDGPNAKLSSKQAFAEVKSRLHQLAAIVLELTTPAPHKDPADWLKAVGLDAFRAAIAGPAASPATAREPGEDDGDDTPTPVFGTHGGAALKVVPITKADARPEIQISHDLERVHDSALRALTKDERIYQRLGRLVHVIRSEAPDKIIKRGADSPRIVPLPAPVLLERLASAATFKKFRKSADEWVPTDPPDSCVKALHQRGQWTGIRPLDGVVEAPILLPDGRVLEQPGYDPSTALLYSPTAAFLKVPQFPSLDDAKAALAELAEVVCDFPFVRPEHRSAWLAALLTPFARHAFQGPVPLSLIDANVPAAGKTLLSDAISVIVCGRGIARISNPDDKEEMRKLVVSILLAGDQLALIDNVEGVFGDDVMNALLTSEEYQGRILGQSEAPKLLAMTCWFVTGNNVIPDRDTNRRVMHIRIESPEEHPELRTGFKHPDLLGWVRQERPRLVRSALTVLRAYFAAGRPDMHLRPWGSYNGWSSIVRACLVWAGQPDPELTREALAESTNLEGMAVEQLINGWEELDPTRSGFTINEMLKKLEDHQDRFQTLRAALAELCPGGNGRAASPKSIGRRFMHLRGRAVKNLAFDQVSKDRTGVCTWGVRSANRAGFAVSAGSLSAGAP